MAQNTKSIPGIKNSPQTILNHSFDEDFQVLATEQLVYNPSACTIDRMVQPGDATSTKQEGFIERVVFNTLKRLNVDSAGRLRVAAESAVIASGTVTTVTTLTNLANWGLSTATAKSQWESHLAFSQGFRNKLTITP